MRPEGEQCNPAWESVKCFESVVKFSAYIWVSWYQDHDKHPYQNPASDHVDQDISVSVCKIFFSCQNRIEDIPNNCCGTSTAVTAAVVKHFGQSFANTEGPGMWYTCEDLVAGIDKLFLPKKNRDHQVGRGGITNSPGLGSTSSLY